jgi:hypothetical protein
MIYLELRVRDWFWFVSKTYGQKRNLDIVALWKAIDILLPSEKLLSLNAKKFAFINKLKNLLYIDFMFVFIGVYMELYIGCSLVGQSLSKLFSVWNKIF